jgi:hypothetical protein
MKLRRLVYLITASGVAVLFSLALETTSFADMTVTNTITVTVGEKTTLFTQTMYWTKSKMRTTDPSGRIMITDLDSKTIIVLMPQEKRYIRDSFDEVKKREAMLPKEIREAKLSVRETGEKRTIDGYPCEKLVFETGSAEITNWVTKKIALDPALKEFNKKFFSLTEDIKTFHLGAQMNAAVEKRGAYPYLVISDMRLPFAGTTQRTESRVKKVSYEKIEASLFAVPEDYKPLVLPGAEAPPSK